MLPNLDGLAAFSPIVHKENSHWNQSKQNEQKNDLQKE